MISFHLFLLASLSHAQSNCENCNDDGYIEKAGFINGAEYVPNGFNRDECAVECTLDPGCKGYTLANDLNKCWLIFRAPADPAPSPSDFQVTTSLKCRDHPKLPDADHLFDPNVNPAHCPPEDRPGAKFSPVAQAHDPSYNLDCGQCKDGETVILRSEFHDALTPHNLNVRGPDGKNNR